MRRFPVLAATAVLSAFAVFAEAGPAGGTGPAAWALPGCRAAPEDPFGDIACAVLTEAELEAALGGDVYMELDESRTRLKVTVTSTDPEAKLGLVPKEVYYVDAHNRVVETEKAAPYMPTAAERKKLGDTSDMRSTPERFPAGTWNITEVRKDDGKFGPNMIKTDAVGLVDTYSAKGEYLGKRQDTGYAIHSNTNDFNKSKSWGCLIVRAEDNERIARSIRDDRACRGRVQRIRIRP